MMSHPQESDSPAPLSEPVDKRPISVASEDHAFSAERTESDLAPASADALDGTNLELDLARQTAKEFDLENVIDANASPIGETTTESSETSQIRGLVSAIQVMEASVGRRLDLLQKSFDRELRAEANRERIVERLHSELQDYKQDLLLKVQRPIFVDLIQLHDDIGKMIEGCTVSPSVPDAGQQIGPALESIRTAIEDILYRQGVEPFSVEGNTFDPRQQRAVSTQTTTEAALNKQICTRLRNGFRAGEKLIRPEIVSVFTFRASV